MQTKNVNVVQPSANKNEKNAAAAAAMNAANQSGQAVNGPAQNGGPLMNGTGINNTNNGRASGSVPTVNSTGGLSVSTMNGLNVASSAINGGVSTVNGGMNGLVVSQSSAAPPSSHYHPLPATSSYIQMSSPYQPLPVTSSHHQPVASPYQPLPVTSSHHQPVTSPYQPLPVTSSHHQPVTSPYQPLPVTSSHHQPVTSQYQPQPVTSQPGLPVMSTPYQPPPLPPRVGSSRQIEAPPTSSTGGCVHSVYKPVPPPKPFSGPVATSAGVTSGSGASPAGEQQQEQQQQHLQQGTLSLRDQLAALTGSTLPASAAPPPPLLPHILVTDQGHFHTHSTKFPIETKEGPSSLPSGSAKLPAGQASSLASGWANLSSWAGPFSRSATLGRGAKGVSGLAGMGVAKGSTLPRSGAPPPAADLRPPTAAHTHPHHTHAGGGGEERDQLLAGERHQRFLDGIDNPALVDDAHMPSYRGPAGGGMHTAAHPSIPPEGTLAGVLPSHPHQRPCESPFLSRPPYRPPTHQQHQTTSQHHPANSQHHPATSQHHPAASQHHPATSNQQTAFTRETWVRSSHGQFSGIVEIHPHQSHLQMNGHAPQHHATTPGHIPNGNTHVHAGSHPDGPYSHSIGHHSHMNGHQDSVHSHNSQNNRTAGPVDDNHANNSQERDDPHKDDKWGSLTRGLAARKYQHLKEKLSSKFSRGDKPDDRTASSQADGKTMTSQGTNTQAISSSAGMNASGSSQQDASGIQAEPSRDSSRIAKLNTSFRKAIHQSSQKTNLQEATMETSLSTNQEQGGLGQHGGVLPPHYSRTPSQYQSQQPPAGPGLPPATHRAALPPPMSSPNLSRQHQHDPLGRGLANRRSGSYHHLAQLRQEPPSWRSHHYSVENLVDAHALPSDHTYSGPAVSSGHSQTTGGEGVGSGGSDSGRGTAGSGGESRVPNTLDTSLDSAASQRQNNQGHSSGNDSEWVDMTDAELQHIMKKGSDGKTNGGLVRRESLAATPPLPPLSPEGTPHPSPRSSPPRHRKYSLSYSCNGLNKPDLLEAAGRDGGKRTSQEGRAGSSSQNSSQSTPRRGGTSQMQQAHSSSKGTSTFAGSNHRSLGVPTIDWSHRKEDERQRSNSYDPLSKNKSIRVNMGPSAGELDTGDMTSTTDALDLDSMLDGVTEATTDDDATSACDPDVHLIRKQLEGLEGMYSEVLKLLGGRRKGRHTIGNGVGLGDLKTSHRRLHGSLSSLPSSIVSSRPGRDKRRVIDDRVRKIGRDGGGKSIHKRFQRLESHVVTLARSVAHLSSEMRTQHLMFQEIESIRGELSALRTGGSGSGAASNTNRNGGHVSWESFRAGIPGLSNPSRVKKLTQFFGDEPPLVRIFLRKLGYEKYAGLFEQEKIGMLELPYLTEERLQKIGIPMGPRLRILQEAQGPIRKEGNLSVYVV